MAHYRLTTKPTRPAGPLGSDLMALVLGEGCTPEEVSLSDDGTAVLLLDGCQRAEMLAERLARHGLQCLVEEAPATLGDSFIDDLRDHVVAGADLAPLKPVDVKAMIREAFRRHPNQEMEQWAGQGFPGREPSLMAVATDWPKPWLFLRVFFFCAVCGALLFAAGTGDMTSIGGLKRMALFVGASLLLLGLTFLAVYWRPKPPMMAFAGMIFLNAAAILAQLVPGQEIGNLKVLPGLILFGAFATPVTCLVFFHEMNVLRNVSVYQVGKFFLAGGVASIAMAVAGFDQVRWLVNALGASSAGLVEELAKLIVVVGVLHWTTDRREDRFPFILNGLLFGAAVGAGFAAFESAGYAFEAWYGSRGSVDDLMQSIFLRGILAPFGHVAWTAVFAGALWYARGDGPLSWKVLMSSRFLRLAPFPILMHMFWNSSAQLPYMLKYLLIGILAWALLRALFEAGLGQIRLQQAKAAVLTAGPAVRPFQEQTVENQPAAGTPPALDNA